MKRSKSQKQEEIDRGSRRNIAYFRNVRARIRMLLGTFPDGGELRKKQKSAESAGN